MNLQIKPDLSVSSATLLFAEAQKRGHEPRWETDYGLFSFVYEDKREFLFFSKLPFNNQLSAEFAYNKHFTHIILDQAGFDTIPYCFPKDSKEAISYLKKHVQIIIKPTKGERAHQVILVNDESTLEKMPLYSMLVEKFIEGQEIRYLILQKKVIAVLKKHHQPLPHRPWHKFNETIPQSDWNVEQAELALKIEETMKLNWCAVDFIVDEDGKPWLIEVNSAPGIKLFHFPDKGKPVDVAQHIFEALSEQ